ncbi:MAG: DMT family transporter [Alphaproteobacteria bacterium]|nr:DMT family transporter [Alphaproteobacteria bacterium]
MTDREPPVVAGRNAGLEIAPARKANPVWAAVWMMGALTSFALMAVAGREISREMDTFQLMFYRSIIGIVIVVAIGAMLPGGLGRFRTGHFRMHLARNVAHFIGQFCWFLSITLISLAEVFAIEFTTPIWVALIAPLFLAESMNRYRAIAIAIGFVGVLVVLRPGVVEFGAGHIAMLIGSFAFSLSMITTKKLSATESPLSILFWMAVLQAPMGLIGSLSDFTLPGTESALWLIVVGVGGLTAHFCIAQAFRWADAMVVAPMDFLRLPLIAVVGMLLYSEALDPFVFLGGAVILVGNWINIRFARRT